MRRKYKVIDLFCGCGGLSSGFENAGYDIVLGIDKWQDAINTFKKAHGSTLGVVADLNEISPQNISDKYNIPDVDVIIGGPPCQGFSIAGKRIIDDERNRLYKSFVDFVKYYKPKAFLMENVPNIISMGKGMIKDAIVQDFKKLGYSVVYKVLLSSHYGVPQNRRRAFFIGTLEGGYVFPNKTVDKVITSEEAISDLTEHSLTDGTPYPSMPLSKYQAFLRKDSKTVYNHKITNHTAKTVKIINLVPDGGNYKDLPEEFRSTRKVNIAWTRLNSKKPSFTIDTGHRHHFHYKYNRVPTVRESARIQSFFDSFIFLGSKTSQYKQVGNAVPPVLARVLAESLKNYLE